MGRSQTAARTRAAYVYAAACTPEKCMRGCTMARPMSNCADEPGAAPSDGLGMPAAPLSARSSSTRGSPVRRGSSSARRARSAAAATAEAEDARVEKNDPLASAPAPTTRAPLCSSSAALGATSAQAPSASARHMVAASAWPYAAKKRAMCSCTSSSRSSRSASTGRAFSTSTTPAFVTITNLRRGATCCVASSPPQSRGAGGL
mmetsp:Transcript_15192/g.65052  ORF Transcript_15192/g.65052 Transcript_15192/m.65052 type:complete len:204 (-) Transcript_15192:111-722(-)